jgi:hypothetical protein
VSAAVVLAVMVALVAGFTIGGVYEHARRTLPAQVELEDLRVLADQAEVVVESWLRNDRPDEAVLARLAALVRIRP